MMDAPEEEPWCNVRGYAPLTYQRPRIIQEEKIKNKTKIIWQGGFVRDVHKGESKIFVVKYM